MADSLSDPLKQLANDVARTVANEAGRDAIELLFRLGLLERPGDGGGPSAALDPTGAARVSAQPGFVGIWEPVAKAGKTSYVRSSDYFDQWALWANVHSIPPKSSKKRVVFLGESVARGYHYDPQYTCAQALEQILGAAGVPGGVEVIDLARTSLEADHLVELLEASFQLEPDLVTIFAGNNWMEVCRPRTQVERYAASRVLREQGVAGLKKHYEQRLADLARERIAHIAELAQSRDVKVVYLIPEFNLADWRCEETALAPWLAEGGNEAWIAARHAALEAFDAERYDDAATYAGRMIELDGGTAPEGLLLLARCRQKKGQHDEANRLFEAARDARIWDVTPQSPRSNGAINETLRTEGPARGLAMVDLPAVFRDRLRGAAADRTLFLDYCHLTAEGIRVAMAAAAGEIARLVGGQTLTVETALAAAKLPAADVEAEARFAAAVHNAHYGQPHDVVYHHCLAAAQGSPKAAAAMRAYIDMQARQNPMWLCGDTERISESGTAALRRYILSYTTTPLPKLFDRVLLDAMADALTKTGAPTRAALDDLRIAEDAVTAERTVDLLSPRYAPFWFQADWHLWPGLPSQDDNQARYFQAHTPVSPFHFVTVGGTPIRLELVARAAPRVGKGHETVVAVNGTQVKRFALDEKWQSLEITVPGSIVQAGVNTLEIRWPAKEFDSDAGIERAARSLEQSPRSQLLPIFGNVHTMIAKAASKAGK